MSNNLTLLKTFFGKYFPEIYNSSNQEKYKDTDLNKLFEQRFLIQNNKPQMIINPKLNGLVINICGNEIEVSKELYDHENIIISNSMETPIQVGNPKGFYNPNIFSTVAYLICQNHTVFKIEGELDEPIYIKNKTDFETFYNSILFFEIEPHLEIEIVEEIESVSALNSVVNYNLFEGAELNLFTFYKNSLAGQAYVYRKITAYDSAQFRHYLFGKGSSNVIDEMDITLGDNNKIELLGVINPNNKKFNSVLFVNPKYNTFDIDVYYKNILKNGTDITFYPVMTVPQTESTTIDVIDIEEDNISDIKENISDILDRAVLIRNLNVKQFYDNKSEFLNF